MTKLLSVPSKGGSIIFEISGLLQTLPGERTVEIEKVGSEGTEIGQDCGYEL